MRQAGGMARTRVGVVLLVPDPWAAEVDGLRRACGDSSLGLIAPHITLISPINVRDDQLDDVLEGVRATAASFPPLRLQLLGAKTFAPSTLVAYLAVGGDADRLLELRRRLVTGPLERPDRYPYVPHVTVVADQPAQRLASVVAALEDYRVDITVSGIHVLRQHDDRIWRPLSHARFAEPAVIGRGGLPLELIVSDLPLRDRDGWCIAARRDRSVVGQASGHIEGTRCLVDSFWVDAPGEGIGSHLLAAVESLAASRDCTHLMHLADNQARGFWVHRGWVDGPAAMTRSLR